MLMPRLPRTLHGAGGEGGFTLIEVMVAALSGVVVMGALFALLQISLHQTSLLNDKVQANQLGRTAMTNLVEELHSACIASGFTPVQAGSGPSKLVFINAYSEGSLISGAIEHEVVWNKSAGTLTDFRYKSKVESGSEWPNFKYPALDYSSSTHQAANATPPTGFRLASNVSETGSTPIFQYYQYAESSSSAEENLPIGSLNPAALPEAETNKAASVLITFTAGSPDGNTALHRGVELRNQVTFAASAPVSETPIKDSPCR
jgi:hypothetical protein